MSNEFAQGYLFGLGTAIVVFIVGFVVLPFIIGFVQGLWRKWKNRNKPEQDWDPVGYIEKVSLTDEGLEVTARLNEGFHGADFITKDALKGLSIGMEGMPIRDRTGYPGYLILDDGEELCMGNNPPRKAHPHCLFGQTINHGPHAVGRVVEKAPDTSWVREVDHG
jgi:hypothetical protein